ncbi:serine/threonine-protein kinase [Streptomyces johnsoniae]|uniref:Serine/threonine-protein kinase n=1 Tax=Streptomyces johnsoniae TaxID=3075532 RepID=A0ABU2SGN2_9ACTN|nr:serine/threonine-protein kinase [Streptomyces sp. DSM 41886]MDT0447044.1 serine/threonine-protein kinase [Streptomyces sp. DSM 41886]
MLLPGTFLKGRYRVKRQIGEGGEGEIFVARDERLGRDVAVKLQLPRAFESSGTYACYGKSIEAEHERLESVADVPGIPRVIDKGSFGRNGSKFLVMELVDGVTIGSWIKAHEPVPTAAVVSVVAQLCDILDVLHTTKGYVHCDITAKNTMLRHDGRVRLLDVGISVVKGTLNKTPAGSPEYAAPEQGDTAAVLTPQVDVFALGALLFEMAVSQLPYYALERPLDGSARPFPDGFGRWLPGPLRELGLAMVSLDAGERPDGVAEVARRLRPLLPAPGSPAPAKMTRPDPTAPYRLGYSVT